MYQVLSSTSLSSQLINKKHFQELNLNVRIIYNDTHGSLQQMLATFPLLHCFLPSQRQRWIYNKGNVICSVNKQSRCYMCFIIFTQNHTRHLSFFKKVTFPVNTFGKIPVRPYIQHQQFILNSGMYPLTTFQKIKKTQQNKKTPNQKILILPISLMNIRHLSFLKLGICLQYIRHCALNLKDTRPSVLQHQPILNQECILP